MGLNDPDETGVDGDGRVHEPSTMRTIADELSAILEAMQRPIGGDKALTGSQQGMTAAQIDAAKFGDWPDAKTFGQTAGKPRAGTEFGKIYADFIAAFKLVADAVEASAGNHATADTRNEGA
ncbi:hypothetical protein OIE66_34970 [Nonomuraea sp. NBC_01738]|uniref:hypothetical protein n=1 Tax=Nonomuraea sp. NBC_01738 TaxID=2976003 RepID=UPI002E0D6FFA|nr:hypothetical protein OIE66_34970 [Nonomuraea sp. NBC_01738]